MHSLKSTLSAGIVRARRRDGKQKNLMRIIMKSLWIAYAFLMFEQLAFGVGQINELSPRRPIGRHADD
jgi:hypothetical protein